MSQGRLYNHCNVIPGLYSCTVHCTHPGYCDADRMAPGARERCHGCREMDDTGCQPSPGHLTSQSECRDHSVSGRSDRHWFKWPQSDNSNLTRQALSGVPTHFYLISHLLSKMMSQSSEVIVIGIIIIIVKSNHLDMIVFHLR